MGYLNRDILNCSELGGPDERKATIEKVLHKYEVEIRSHLKMEKEFKKMAKEADSRSEELRVKVKDIEEQLLLKSKEAEELTKQNKKLLQIIQEFEINESKEQKNSLFVKNRTNNLNSKNQKNKALKLRLEHLHSIEAPLSGTCSSLCVPSKKTENLQKLNRLNYRKHTKNSSLNRIRFQH